MSFALALRVAMDEAIEFMRGYLATLHQCTRSCYVERDGEKFASLKRGLWSSLDAEADVYPGLNRQYEPDEAWFAQMSREVDQVVPRLLFQVKQYEHPTFGQLFQAYVGGEFDYSRASYSDVYFLAAIEGRLKIIARYFPCITCLGRDETGRRACGECGGTGLEYNSGRKIDDPGPLVGVAKLVAPSDPTSLADYQRE